MEFLMFCVFLYCLMTVVVSLEVGMKCTGHMSEIECYRPDDGPKFCYYPWQRCDGIPDCPHSKLADECLCKMFCESMKDYRYCKETDTCVSWGKMCPVGATVDPEPIVCPDFAPHACWRTSGNIQFTTTARPCYSSREKCDGVRDCVGGEDEEDCEDSSSRNTLIYIAFAVGVLAILVPVCVFFLIRRWQRNRRLREEANNNNNTVDVDVSVRVHVSRRSYGDTSNPVFGLPPPCYPDESNGQMVETTGEFPPPYILKPPSNEGPQSVLPTYSEAVSSKTDASEPNQTGSQRENT